MWVNNQPVDTLQLPFQTWKEHKVDVEMCLSLELSKHKTVLVWDLPCYTPKPYICEKGKLSIILSHFIRGLFKN